MLKKLHYCLGTSILAAMLALPLVAQATHPSVPSTQPPSTMNPNGMNGVSDPAMNGQHMDTGARKMMKSADSVFALKAAQGGLAEVKMGQLAADKGSSPDVKAFGQQMVDDHTKANDQLKSVAQEEGMTLPSDVNAKQQAMYDKLSKMSGAEFDKAYVKSMVSDHQEDVKDFTKESNNGKDSKIKGFASQTLPVIQGHLDKIKGIQSKVGSGSSM